MHWIYWLFGALIGASIGSFLAATVWRAQQGVSLLKPSACPACGQAIPPWRNIPVLSWVLQRGRAACCGSSLSPRYVSFEACWLLAGAAVGGLSGMAGIIGFALAGLLGGLAYYARRRPR